MRQTLGAALRSRPNAEGKTCGRVYACISVCAVAKAGAHVYMHQVNG